MKYSMIVLLPLLWFAGLDSYAISPEEAADAILGHNGDIMVNELLRDAKNKETLSIANAPDPEIEGDYLVAPSGEENRWGLGLSYSFDWPGVYKARRDLGVALRQVNNADALKEIYFKRIEILDEVWTYLYAKRRLEVMEMVADATDSIAELAKMANSGGELSRLDLLKVAIEQSKIRSMVAAIEDEMQATLGNLQTFNGGMSCNIILQSIGNPWNMRPVTPLDSYMNAVSESPELAKAMADFALSEKNLKLAKSERLPGFKVGYAHEYEDGIHFNGANVGVSVPLFSSRHKVKAAEAAKAAAEYRMSVESDKKESEVKSLYNEILSLDKALETPLEVFKNNDYTSLLTKAYKGGELSMTDYLTELSWFYEAHLNFMELQYQRERKLSRLSLLTK